MTFALDVDPLIEMLRHMLRASILHPGQMGIVVAVSAILP
jgi:hypothetical protein